MNDAKKIVKRNQLRAQAIDFLVKSKAVVISSVAETFAVPESMAKAWAGRRLIRRHALEPVSHYTFTDKDDKYLLYGFPAVILQLCPSASFSGVDVEKVFDDCTTAKSLYKDVPGW